MTPLNPGTRTTGWRHGMHALRRCVRGITRRFTQPLSGQFQPYSHTLPDRYPFLFRIAAAHLGNCRNLRILSFGCSRGDEVMTLRRYFPDAAIRGIDISPRNIACALARPDLEGDTEFKVAATTEDEPAESYHAIFCLAVLCNGDLTTSGAQRCDPLLSFERFERIVADFARCLKPGGLLLLHTTNFRFGDTTTSRDFEVVLDADPAQLAPDVLFDRENRLLQGARYCSVAFRKIAPAAGETPVAVP